MEALHPFVQAAMKHCYIKMPVGCGSTKRTGAFNKRCQAGHRGKRCFAPGVGFSGSDEKLVEEISAMIHLTASR